MMPEYPDAAANNGMRPTADTLPIIYIHHSRRRVTPGVRRWQGESGESHSLRPEKVRII